METAGTSPKTRFTGKWYVLGGVAGAVFAVVVPTIAYLFPFSILVLVFGLLKWTHEASTARVRQVGVSAEAEPPSQLASAVFFTEVAVLSLSALGFVGIGLFAIGIGDFATEDAGAHNQAALVLLTFLVLALGCLAWAVNRWAFRRRRSAYLIPVLIPVAAIGALAAVRLLLST